MIEPVGARGAEQERPEASSNGARLVSPSELGAEGVVTRTGAHRFVQKLDAAPRRRDHRPAGAITHQGCRTRLAAGAARFDRDLTAAWTPERGRPVTTAMIALGTRRTTGSALRRNAISSTTLGPAQRRLGHRGRSLSPSA